MRVLVGQSCPTLCNSMDCSPPGSSVHGILQARILECIPVSYRIESFHTINYCCVFKDKETGDSVVFPLEECLLIPGEINGQFSRQRQGFYWTNTDCEANHAKAFTFYIGDCGVGVISDYKYRGRFIRPVAE